MNELTVGDRVRVVPLCALGTIVRISERLRHAPYLVAVEGYGERSFAASDLVKQSPPAAEQSPPPAEQPPVTAVRVGMVLKCGACGSLNMSSTHCRQCNARWVLP